MSGVMVKVALYGLIRVLFEWVGRAAGCGSGWRCSALGAAVGARRVLYALVQRDLKRLLAFSTIENVGIVALGLGAALAARRGRRCRLERDRLRRRPAARAQPRASSRRCCSSAPARSQRAAGALDLDRARRAAAAGCRGPGGAFLVGGAGDRRRAAAERLRLRVADPAVAAPRRARGPALGSALAGALAAAGLAATAALALLCFVKAVGPGPARAAAPAGAARRRARRRAGCAPRGRPLPARPLRRARRRARAAGAASLRSGRRRGQPAGRPARPRRCPAPARCRSPLAAAGDRSRSSARSALRARPRRRAAPAPAWACGQRLEPALAWTLGRLHEAAARSSSSAVLRPRREVVDRARADGVVSRSPTAARSRTCSTPRSTRRLGARRSAAPRRARRLQSGSAARVRWRTCWRCSSALLLRWCGWGRSDERRDGRRGVQVLGGVALAPLLPGAIQTLEGAPAGPPRAVAAAALPRAAPAVGQERLADPQPSAVVYRLAPRLVAAASGPGRLLLVPIAGRRPGLGAGQRRAGRWSGCWRSAALRARRSPLGHRQRLRADGRGARPDLRRLRRGAAAARAGARRAAGRRAPTWWRSRPPPAAAAPGASPATGARRSAFALVVAGRDRTPADRQPRHPPRADDDPRGAAARVRGPRPGAAAVGRRRAPLDRARARASSCSLPALAAASAARSRCLAPALAAALRRARPGRDGAGEDADPARAGAARRRAPRSALVGAGQPRCSGGAGVSGGVSRRWSGSARGDRRCAAAALAILLRRGPVAAARRRPRWSDGRGDRVGPARRRPDPAGRSGRSRCRLLLAVAPRAARREPAPVAPADAPALGRLAAAAALPAPRRRCRRSGSATPAASSTRAVALVCARDRDRRAAAAGAVFQVLGFLVAENGVYLAALVVPGGLPLAGRARRAVRPGAGRRRRRRLQLRRSTSTIGTGDTDLLRELRD